MSKKDFIELHILHLLCDRVNKKKRKTKQKAQKIASKLVINNLI